MNEISHRIEDRLIDINVVADRLGVNVRHVRRLVAERRIPFVKWGHLIRFNPTEINGWIAEHTHVAVNDVQIARGSFETSPRRDQRNAVR